METALAGSYSCPDTDSLLPVAEQILKSFPEKRVFTFSGPMGSGKTTFIKAFCKALGCEDSVSSPTFTIVNEYRSATAEPVYHFGFYRTNSEAEVYDLGYEDYLYSGCYIFMEWPERIPGLLHGDEVNVTIATEGETRIITVRK